MSVGVKVDVGVGFIQLVSTTSDRNSYSYCPMRNVPTAVIENFISLFRGRYPGWKTCVYALHWYKDLT